MPEPAQREFYECLACTRQLRCDEPGAQTSKEPNGVLPAREGHVLSKGPTLGIKKDDGMSLAIVILLDNGASGPR